MTPTASRSTANSSAGLVAAVLLLVASPLAAQEGGIAGWEPPATRDLLFPLTIRSFSQGPELLGQSPQGVSWTDDSRWIYFQWLPGGHDWDASREYYRVPAQGGELELLGPEVSDSLAVTFASGDLSPDRTLRVTSHRGDLYLVDRNTVSVRRLTETAASKTDPRFSGDGGSIFFRQGNELLSMDLAGGAVRQIADVRPGVSPDDDEEAEGHRRFLEDQQEELFEHIRRRLAREREAEAREEARREGEVRPVFVGSGWQPNQLQPDPTGSRVAVTAVRSAEGTRPTVVPLWITEDGYTEPVEVRTKVGDATSVTRVGIHPVRSDTIVWLDVQSQIQRDAESTDPVGPHDPVQLQQVRDGDVEVTSVSFRGWNESGNRGIVFAVSYDDKHRWLYSVDGESGSLTLLEHLADSAWVAGPCFNCVGWIPDSDRVYYVSEADGFAHLYIIASDGSDRRRLTEGPWEVHSVQIPEDRDRFFLRTNEGSPFSQHFFTMGFDGSNRTRITEGRGHFDATPSPDGTRMAVVHSRGNRPPELFVAPFQEGADLTEVTRSPTAEWLSFPWEDPQIIHFTGRDGVEVPARIYRPESFGVEANGAAVLFVHGAGYLQNVHHWWSSYSREYMYHHYLAAQGFTVLDIDFRASAGYGRDWRTAVYRWMGGADLWDYVDGTRWLVENEGIHPNRIGIYGGSYGGFLTLMALFTEPETFQAGVALRSVTDWAHYNHGYTSRILNLPHEDDEAYRRSSPIYFAEGLEGRLLMGHPMYDTNVHFQDIVRLVQRLIELEKEGWELSVYPTENHGMVEPTSWVDQYRRMHELFVDVLLDDVYLDDR
jgi:dipeptidyl aminopeptidase/acylaminoacyl peptidase